MWGGDDKSFEDDKLSNIVSIFQISGLLRFRGGVWQELEDVRRGDDKSFEDDKLSNIVSIF